MLLVFSDTEKLSKDDQAKLERNISEIVKTAQIKRITHELVAASVIDFDTKKKWKTITDEMEVADDFVELLHAGTKQKLEKAKDILRTDDQDHVADLLP